MSDSNNKRYVRVRGGFSDRNKINPISTVIQIDNFSNETRTVIKNKIIKILEQYKDDYHLTSYDYEKQVGDFLAENLFNIPLDTRASSFDNVIRTLYNCIDDGCYDEILDVIEFLAQSFKLKDHERSYFQGYNVYKTLYEDFNDLFKTECIGYRFINSEIVQISDQNEIKSIIEAGECEITQVQEHLNKATSLLKATGENDYKKSIAESVMALESLLKFYCPGKEDTITQMLKVIDKNKKVHPTLKEAIQKIYWFACDEPGIRHENNKESKEIGFDEAKFALVSISAIINYLKPNK